MPNLVRLAAIAASSGLLLASFAGAQAIYKWVDKDGRTHYSSRKEDAGGAPTTTLRTDPAPAPDAGAPPAARAANEEIIRRGVAAEPGAAKSAEPRPLPKPSDRNYRSEASAAKCQLARDILSGRATHSSGAPVDAYDRQTAENDMRAFCGK